MSKQRQDSAVTGTIKPRRRATARRWDEEEEERRRNAQAAAAAKTEAKQQRAAEETRWNKRPAAPANAKSAAERQREAEEARWNRRPAAPANAKSAAERQRAAEEARWNRRPSASAKAKSEAARQREAEEARWNRRPAAPANAKSAAERQREAEEARWNRRPSKPEDARGGVSKPDDPKGFVSQFGENFKLDKNPFYLVKPDGTSDLTPKQQEEAAAIFGNIFDGKSYSDYKVKEAAKALLKQAAAKEQEQEQEAARWDRVSKTSHEQERDEGEEEKPEGEEEKPKGENEQQDDRPPAERRADELDESMYVPRLKGDESGQYFFFEGDTYAMSFAQNGNVNELHMSVKDLPPELSTKLISDDEYRLEFASAINNYFEEKIDPDGLGINDESLSAEIWGHVAGYRITQLLMLPTYAVSTAVGNRTLFALLRYFDSKFKTMEAGGDWDVERAGWDYLAKRKAREKD